MQMTILLTIYENIYLIGETHYSNCWCKLKPGVTKAHTDEDYEYDNESIRKLPIPIYSVMDFCLDHHDSNILNLLFLCNKRRCSCAYGERLKLTGKHYIKMT